MFAGQTSTRRRDGDRRIHTAEGVGARQVLRVHVRQEQGIQIKSATVPVLHLRRIAVSLKFILKFFNITPLLVFAFDTWNSKALVIINLKL